MPARSASRLHSPACLALARLNTHDYRRTKKFPFALNVEPLLGSAPQTATVFKFACGASTHATRLLTVPLQTAPFPGFLHFPVQYPLRANPFPPVQAREDPRVARTRPRTEPAANPRNRLPLRAL